MLAGGIYEPAEGRTVLAHIGIVRLFSGQAVENGRLERYDRVISRWISRDRPARTDFFELMRGFSEVP